MAVQKLQQSETKTTYRVLHQLTEKEKQDGSIFVKIKKNKRMSVTYKDFNGDGFISENEVYKIERYRQYESVTGKQVTEILQQIDDNGDGKLDLNRCYHLIDGKLSGEYSRSLEWGAGEEFFIKDARSAWIGEIEFTEDELY